MELIAYAILAAAAGCLATICGVLGALVIAFRSRSWRRDNARKASNPQPSPGAAGARVQAVVGPALGAK